MVPPYPRQGPDIGGYKVTDKTRMTWAKAPRVTMRRGAAEAAPPIVVVGVEPSTAYKRTTIGFTAR